MNVLYFVCHDLGRALGCYGAGLPTPRLDAFARQSLRFTQAHCTSPACSPSRACAMTGLHAHRSGAIGLSHMGWPLDLRWTTTVDDFNAADYETILSGINHERHPRTDRYARDLNRGWDDWRAECAVDNALAALRTRDPGRPFYLNIATQEPHACTWNAVGGRIPALPEGGPVWLPPGMARTPALEGAFHRFASAVAHLDRQFGRLLDGLDRLGLADDTLVVFTTDHGMAGPRGKGWLYGLGTEIALLARHPRSLGAGAVCDTLVSNIDFRPTWCELAGLPAPADIDGRSFAACFGNPSHTHRDALFLTRNFHGERPTRREPDYVDCHDPLRAIRTRDALYIRTFAPEVKPPDPTPAQVQPLPSLPWSEWHASWAFPSAPRPVEELYDLRVDPLETIDRAAAPEARALLEGLRDRLAREMAATGDHLPGPPPPRPEPPGWGPNWPAV